MTLVAGPLKKRTFFVVSLTIRDHCKGNRSFHILYHIISLYHNIIIFVITKSVVFLETLWFSKPYGSLNGGSYKKSARVERVKNFDCPAFEMKTYCREAADVTSHIEFVRVPWCRY